MKSLCLSLCVLASCASSKDEIKNPTPAVSASAATAPAPTPPMAAPVGDQATGGVVEMSVTDSGFEPDEVPVKKGQPVKLVITRKTDATCAKDIVIPEQGIRQALPLNKPVEVTFTPTKSGELKYGCAMNQMVGGVLVVQ
jgi:plastocyanin